jgi:hypothetical protein
MTSEAKIAACRINGKKSKGPTTPEGRERSSMNAYKHGLRSKIEALIREDSYAFENRKLKWMAKVNPTDDMGEFLAYQTVAAWTEIEYAERAEAERTATLLDTHADTQIEAVKELGRRLFHDRCGPTAFYGILATFRSGEEQEQKTSSSGKSADPDHPAKLVAELEKTWFGCIWLRDQWEELREQAEHLWQSPDRLKCARLLGRQPADAAIDRTIADMFVASDALHHSGTTAFADLFSDVDESQLKKFLKRVKVRWPDLFDIDDKAKGRAHLLALTEENIERLNELISEFEQKSDEIARRNVDRLRRDNTPEGHRMRNYVYKARDAFDRRRAKSEKYEKYNEKMKDHDERPPRRIVDDHAKWIGRASRIDQGSVESSGWANGGPGDSRHPSPLQSIGLDKLATGSEMPEEVDLSWAYEATAHSAEARDVNGLAGANDNSALGESEVIAAGLESGRAGFGTADADAAGLEPRPPGICTEDSGSVEAGHAGLAAAQENGMSEPVGKGQDFANEPKMEALVENAQALNLVWVESDFEVAPGLDNVARKVKEVDGNARTEGGGRRAEDVGSEAGDQGRKTEDGEVNVEDVGSLAVEGEDNLEQTLKAGEVVEPETGRSEVQGQSQVAETGEAKLELQKRRNETGNLTLESAIPASEVQNRKLERKRRRLEKERRERKAIERKIEQAFIKRKGNVTSATKLIEEVLWPSRPAGGKVRGTHSRSP